MLFGNKKKSKGIESFNTELCKNEKSKKYEPQWFVFLAVGGALVT